MPVESYEGGTVLKLVGEPDTVIAAGTPIAILGAPGEKVEPAGVPATPGEQRRVRRPRGPPAQAGPGLGRGSGQRRAAEGPARPEHRPEARHDLAGVRDAPTWLSSRQGWKSTRSRCADRPSGSSPRRTSTRSRHRRCRAELDGGLSAVALSKNQALAAKTSPGASGRPPIIISHPRCSWTGRWSGGSAPPPRRLEGVGLCPLRLRRLARAAAAPEAERVLQGRPARDRSTRSTSAARWRRGTSSSCRS